MKYKNKFIPFIIQWFFLSNNQDIGTLLLSIISGLIGTLLFVVIRFQLALLGYRMMNYHTYNVTSHHFLFIISFVVMPAFIGVLTKHILVVTLLNFIIKDMFMHRLLLSTCSSFVTAVLVAGAIAALLLDRNFDAVFFDPSFGYCNSLFKRVFCFFVHLEVYISVLPVSGIMSHVIGFFSRISIFGYLAMVFIGFVVLLVWVHHTYAVGLDLDTWVFFTAATMIIMWVIFILKKQEQHAK